VLTRGSVEACVESLETITNRAVAIGDDRLDGVECRTVDLVRQWFSAAGLFIAIAIARAASRARRGSGSSREP